MLAPNFVWFISLAPDQYCGASSGAAGWSKWGSREGCRVVEGCNGQTEGIPYSGDVNAMLYFRVFEKGEARAAVWSHITWASLLPSLLPHFTYYLLFLLFFFFVIIFILLENWWAVRVTTNWCVWLAELNFGATEAVGLRFFFFFLQLIINLRLNSPVDVVGYRSDGLPW